MRESLTIRLDEELAAMLSRAARVSGRTRSEVAREALRRQVAIVLLEQFRSKVMPFAEAQGLLTDEDVFRLVS